MFSGVVVELSHWPFAVSAMLHFLFMPLTLGLVLLLVLMESAYVWSGQVVYKTMAQFWGRIFAINFGLALATRLAMVFQLGMNASYFAYYAGEVLALPLAIEALTSLVLMGVVFGPYWFGWNSLSAKSHLFLAWVIVLAVHASAYWLMVGYAWLQNPLGAVFNYQSYRMELLDFEQILANPLGMNKFIHVSAAAYVLGCAMILAISAYRLLRNRDDQIAAYSYKPAAILGLLAVVLSLGLAEPSADAANLTQRVKNAAISGEFDKSLSAEIEASIGRGVTAFTALQELRDGNSEPQWLADFEQYRADLGYAWLLLPIHKKIVGADAKQIALAAQSAFPQHSGLIFWAFRLMVAVGFIGLLGFALAVWVGFIGDSKPACLLKWHLYLLPLLWSAAIAGWIVAECGMQPWTVAGVLPAFMSISSQSVTQLLIGALVYVIGYGGLLMAAWQLLHRAIMMDEFENGVAK